ncbi:MAG: type II toxin-antitoxin system ParD family antitoxin [Bacteroidia bacterium]|nr:type II toxin-antitoxin system ParD family antitoxin [Bacteroidia bacterium]
MGKNTSVSLGNHFENFIDFNLSKGRYKNASEIVRAGLRLLEEEENCFAALKNAIEEGLESGIAKRFEPKNYLEFIKAKKNAKS